MKDIEDFQEYAKARLGCADPSPEDLVSLVERDIDTLVDVYKRCFGGFTAKPIGNIGQEALVRNFAEIYKAFEPARTLTVSKLADRMHGWRPEHSIQKLRKVMVKARDALLLSPTLTAAQRETLNSFAKLAEHVDDSARSSRSTSRFRDDVGVPLSVCIL